MAHPRSSLRFASRQQVSREGVWRTELRAELLRRRADAHLALAGDTNLLAAAVDADAAVELDPNNVEIRRTRAALKTERGDHAGAFGDLRAAAVLVGLGHGPETPSCAELHAAIASAARLAMGQQSSRTTRGSSKRGGGTKSGAAPAMYRTLELTADATAREIKRAYRKQAAIWHPDKWMDKSPEEQLAATERFQKLAEAYETLREPKRRTAYDADPRGYTPPGAAHARDEP